MNIYTQKSKKIIIEKLKNKEIGILPTDTIYGISSIIHEDLRRRINEIKKSDLNKNLIVLISSLRQAHELAVISKKEISILKNPQPTTVLCKLNEKYYNKNIVLDNLIAIRLVKNKFLKKIINKTGPLYSTSANISKDKYIGNIDVFKKINVNFIVFDDFNNNTHSMIYDSINNKFLRK